MSWTSWHLRVWHQLCQPCLSGELAHYSPDPKIGPLLHPHSHCPLLTCPIVHGTIRRKLPQILGARRSEAPSPPVVTLVPPLFFLNFVLLLVFLLCGMFLASSPFQRGGARDRRVGVAGGEKLPPRPGKYLLMPGSGRLPDPTSLGRDFPGSWSRRLTVT